MTQNHLHRIIDANINRSSEALRVLEEWARFGKDSTELSEKLKNIRHNINKLFSNFQNLILSRESILDVGKEIKNTSEKTTVRDIIRANSKRLEESLRVLAEYGEILKIEKSILEKARFEIYTIEKELIKNEKLIRLNNAKLYLVTSKENFKNESEFLNVIEKSVEGGVDIIQLREKKESENKILKLANEIKKIVLKTEVLFIVNDRVDLALACHADGVHLGQDDLEIKEARKITPEGFIIGLSTHSEEQGKNSLTSGADYIGVGPVFKTPTKPDYDPTGLEYVNWASKNIKNIPWFAIGGIDETNIHKVIHEGAEKIAVVRAIMNSNDPLNATKKIKETLKKEKACLS